MIEVIIKIYKMIILLPFLDRVGDEELPHSFPFVFCDILFKR